MVNHADAAAARRVLHGRPAPLVVSRLGRFWRSVALVCFAAVVGCSGSPETSPEPPVLDALPALPEATAVAEQPRGPERPVRPLTLTFVGEVRGEIAPCGCPTLPYGGFERRERLLDRLRARETVIHLDAGETLVKGLITLPPDERAERAADVLRLSQEVGVQVWVPGPSDLLGLGTDGIGRLIDGRLPAPPVVSATWEGSDGSLLFPAARVVEADGLRVGVVGLSAQPSAPEVDGIVRMRDPVQAAKQAVAALPADLDLVVGLGSVTDQVADRVAVEVPEIGLMLTTRGIDTDEPRVAEDAEHSALIVESTDRGRYLSVIRTRLGTTAAMPVIAHPARHHWKAFHTAREQVDVMRALPEASEATEAQEDVRDPRRLAVAEAALAEQEARFVEAGRGRNIAYVSSIPLAEDLDGDTRIAETMQAVRSLREDRAESTAQTPISEAPHGYAAASACVTCHTNEFTRWTYTDHARAAWTSLLKRNETDNVECVQCHTTGFGQPGGFGELTSGNLGRFKAVQCEACHGPLVGHPDDPRVKAEPVTVQTCLGCHDEANSPDFDYESYLRRATCQGGAPELMPGAP